MVQPNQLGDFDEDQLEEMPGQDSDSSLGSSESERQHAEQEMKPLNQKINDVAARVEKIKIEETPEVASVAIVKGENISNEVMLEKVVEEARMLSHLEVKELVNIRIGVSEDQSGIGRNVLDSNSEISRLFAKLQNNHHIFCPELPSEPLRSYDGTIYVGCWNIGPNMKLWQYPVMTILGHILRFDIILLQEPRYIVIHSFWKLSEHYYYIELPKEDHEITTRGLIILYKKSLDGCIGNKKSGILMDCKHYANDKWSTGGDCEHLSVDVKLNNKTHRLISMYHSPNKDTQDRNDCPRRIHNLPISTGVDHAHLLGDLNLQDKIISVVGKSKRRWSTTNVLRPTEMINILPPDFKTNIKKKGSGWSRTQPDVIFTKDTEKTLEYFASEVVTVHEPLDPVKIVEGVASAPQQFDETHAVNEIMRVYEKISIGNDPERRPNDYHNILVLELGKRANIGGSKYWCFPYNTPVAKRDQAISKLHRCGKECQIFQLLVNRDKKDETKDEPKRSYEQGKSNSENKEDKPSGNRL